MKHTAIYTFLFLLCSLWFLACNNDSTSTTANTDTTVRTPPAVISSLPAQSEMEILSGCVENAKAQLGEQKAYVLCKCVLGQVQQKYPSADSTAIVAHLSDSTEVRQLAQQCQ